MVGVICPSEFEYRYIKSLRLPARRAALVRSGMGKVRSLHACHELLHAHGKIRRILLVGYAGGLSAGLRVGDLIEPNTFIEYDYDARPFEPFPNTIRLPGRKLFRRSKKAAIVTQDRFLKENPFRGTPLELRHPNLACDMESYAVAYFCLKRKVPLSVLKFVSDSADGSADHDFLKACRDLAPELKRTVLEAVERS